MTQSISLRLEKYTIKRREEVLMVELETTSGESDTILIYNGFSGSLMRPTTYDPDIPVIEDDAKIISIDRLTSPYDPANPTYIQTGLTLSEMEKLLTEMGV
ncbi:MAG: hypothetical protein QNJ70_28795 [Xenococcaceae cyanobacterium MO_207.B15]|nr:hypothetical protein [Xenococcaceae cyanobacterium MO_207.B15]